VIRADIPLSKLAMPKVSIDSWTIEYAFLPTNYQTLTTSVYFLLPLVLDGKTRGSDQRAEVFSICPCTSS
jgi:hypothetical protein